MTATMSMPLQVVDVVPQQIVRSSAEEPSQELTCPRLAFGVPAGSGQCGPFHFHGRHLVAPEEAGRSQ